MPIFFWTGEEDFLIQEKKEKWIKAFKEKHGGDMNIAILDGEELSAGEITSDIEALPFLGEKRLVFINKLPPPTKKKLDEKKGDAILAALETLPESTVLVFLQAQPDKRMSFYKKLSKIAQAEVFQPLKGHELESWVSERVKKCGGTILPSAIPYLIEHAGEHLWRLANEIDKLIAFTGFEKSISENDIKKLVDSYILSNVFHCIDAISERKQEKAIKELQALQKSGESLMQFFALLIRQLRSLIIAKSDPTITKEILIKECKLHPFVAQKVLHNAKNFSFSELQNIYKKCLLIDHGSKTGKIPLSTGNEKALVLEIEKIIIQL